MIPPQGIGAVSLIFEEKAPIPYGRSFSSWILVQMRLCVDALRVAHATAIASSVWRLASRVSSLLLYYSQA